MTGKKIRQTCFRFTIVSVFAFLFAVNLFALDLGTVKGVVKDASLGTPLAAANVLVVSTNRGASSDLEGLYSITLPSGKYTLLVRYLGYKPQKVDIEIIPGQNISKDFMLETDLIGVDEVVCIGTRRIDRSVVDSPVPIDIVTSHEIRSSGLTQTTDIIQMLVPSFNAPKPAIRDGSDHVRPATLRGLGPDQVLILVNGKRRHTSALVHVNGSVGRGSTGVDMNAIPASSIDRIEVLRDGAAAQYGSDAIAGVINIVLKKDAGFDATASYGMSYSSEERGYDEPQSVATYPWADKIEDISHTDGEKLTLHLGYGWEMLGGNVYASSQIRQSGGYNRSAPDPRQQYLSLPDGSDDSREAGFDDLNHEFGEGELNDYSLFLNSNFPMKTAGLSLYMFGGFSRREGLSGGFYRRSQDDRTVRSIHPDGFLPKISSGINDLAFTTGLKGNLGQWAYDASQTYGTNTFEFGVENSNNVSMGTASPTKFEIGQIGFKQATTNIDFFKATDFIFREPTFIALGTEFRWENYTIEAGEESSYLQGDSTITDGPNDGNPAPGGAQVFPGFSPKNAQDESRYNIAFYADVENNITPLWMLSLAGRFENYSDFGNTLTGKMATRYSVTPDLAIRGAASTGFRAPSLAQSYYSSVSTQFINGVPFELGTFPVNSDVAIALGAEELKAEKSINLSGGMTWTIENLSLTADAYQIDIYDRIVFTEDFRGDSIAAFLQDTLGLQANGGRYFTNALDTRTQGLDFTARYSIRLFSGIFRLTSAINFNNTEISNKDNVNTAEKLRQYTSTPLLGRVEQGRFENGQPGSTLNFMANYSIGKSSFMVREIRYGEVTDFNSDPANDQTFGEKWMTDCEVAYDIYENVTLQAGSSNLFDNYPDKNYIQNSFNGILPYSRNSSPTGFMGRYIYTKLRVKF
ncbi:MAG: TonB-dependent receptor [Candidatus Electryonea clarkiae]|nr:TonB-dependent receptor [Candidatus Electryonea clarkiae]MDP8288190.1 TonB-dependent receptor [Candidatus Electryonea clarkiae]